MLTSVLNFYIFSYLSKFKAEHLDGKFKLKALKSLFKKKLANFVAW